MSKTRNQLHIVAPDYRAVKRVTRPRLRCQSCGAAQATLPGIALMYMLKKRQMGVEEGTEGPTVTDQCYALAASAPRPTVSAHLQLSRHQTLRRNLRVSC
jgi:hypothetical protein